jgi:polar amino acid transport system permease protein
MELSKVSEVLFSGVGVSLKIFGLTLLFSIPLGMLVALGRMSKFKPLSWLLSLYILIMRGTPLMLQIIAVFFAVPLLQQNPPAFLADFFAKYQLEPIDRFTAVIIAFSINYAAYFAEIFRGGIQSISKGQYEAGACLGFTKTQTFFKIVLPQVVKRVLPATSNEVITLVKDTSLAQVIGVTELFVLAKQQMNLYTSLVPLFIAGLFYLVMCIIITIIFWYIEKRLNYYK